jgi:hypothetical protein
MGGAIVAVDLDAQGRREDLKKEEERSWGKKGLKSR